MLQTHLLNVTSRYVRTRVAPVFSAAAGEDVVAALGLSEFGSVERYNDAPRVRTPWTLAGELCLGDAPSMDSPEFSGHALALFLVKARLERLSLETVLAVVRAVTAAKTPIFDNETEAWLLSVMDTAAGERVVLAVLRLQLSSVSEHLAWHTDLLQMVSENCSSLCRAQIRDALCSMTQEPRACSQSQSDPPFSCPNDKMAIVSPFDAEYSP